MGANAPSVFSNTVWKDAETKARQKAMKKRAAINYRGVTGAIIFIVTMVIILAVALFVCVVSYCCWIDPEQSPETAIDGTTTDFDFAATKQMAAVEEGGGDDI